MKKRTVFNYLFQSVNKIKQTLFIICCIGIVQNNYAQNIDLEVGAAIGNVIDEEHTLAKGEIFFSVLKSYNFGDIGIDFSTGGNFIPGTRSIMEENIETLSPNDSKFWGIAILYRHTVKKHFFVEPRVGYASLYSYVHTDNTRRISQPNFTAGFGVGGKIERFTVSLRYQYYGKTANFEGLKGNTIVRSNSRSLGLILLRFSYRFGLGNLFSKKQENNKE